MVPERTYPLEVVGTGRRIRRQDFVRRTDALADCWLEKKPHHSILPKESARNFCESMGCTPGLAELGGGGLDTSSMIPRTCTEGDVNGLSGLRQRIGIGIGPRHRHLKLKAN